MEHDASAALARDGQIVAAISEERLSRKKGQWGYPWRAMEECLRIGGIQKKDVDLFSVSLNKFPASYFRKPTWLGRRSEQWHRLRRKLLGRSEEVTLTVSDFLRDTRAKGNILCDLFDWERFREDGFEKAHIRFVDHHHAHAHSAAHFSGFDDALVITVDCVGACFAQDETEAHTLESLFLQNVIPLSHTTSTWSERKLRRLHITDLNGSPGSFYGSVTEALGFISPRHEGKVTGLAAWGKTHALDDPFKHVLALSHDKTHFVSEQIWRKGVNISEARKAVIRKTMKGHSREEVSGAAQRILENAVIGHVEWAVQQTGLKKVALAGGVFGNVKLNQRIMELKGVEQIFVFPAMSDAGLAVAAAQIASNPKSDLRNPKLNDVYLGPEFSNAEVERVLKDSGFKYQKLSATERPSRAAKWIADGKVLGLFQGRMEFGPRALGNRSILAAPVRAEINDDLNRRLSRSEFMPFAPSVISERCSDIFENFHKGSHAAEFMTVTYTVKEDWRPKIPAVVHIDGTARPQVVYREKNPRYYDILKAYDELTKLPVVVNTSFNVHEEPIVCRPEEAIQALREKRIDALLIEDFWVE
jgi:carbamoyltransferase